MNKLSTREDSPNANNNKSSHLGLANFPWILFVALGLAITLSQPAEAVQFTYGTYVGNGVDGRSITGVGFQPDAVIIKSSSGNYAVMRTTTMAGDATKQLAAGNGLQTNRIQSLNADGFTVGNNGEVNSSGTTYYWMAYKDTGEGDFKVGSYTGNGLDNRSITGVGFQPDYLIVMSAAGQKAVQRSSAMVGDKSLQFDGSASAANLVQALETGGFQVGNDNQVNSNGTAYHYVVWKAIIGKTKVGSYVGNGLDNRSIAGIGFKPEYVIVKGDSGAMGVHRSASITGDSTLRFPASGIISNSIQDLQSDSFQVGTDSTANANGTTYYWVAFNAISEASKLAITSVNSGTNPVAGTPFAVVVQSQDINGALAAVNAATGVALSLKTGTGTLGGTLTGTISAGTSQVTISGVTYTKAESGVILTATSTSGDALTSGDSSPFTVDPGLATTLAFTTQPANTNAGSAIAGPPTATVQDNFANTVTSSTASITVAIGTNPSGGVLGGTTTNNASGGVASFSDLSIDQAGTGYTLTASSTGLTGATTNAFNIIAVVPDLIVSSLSNPPASAVAGASFNVTDTTANNGNGTAGASTTSYRLSLDNIISPSDPLLTGSRSVPSLAASGTSSGTITVSIPSNLTPGTYFLGACADEADVVAEANETNNCLASSTTVTVSAAPVITSLSPTSGPIATPVTITGSNFGATQGSSTVKFNGTTATPTTWSATSIVAPVPTGATTGPVIVTVGGSASNGVNFNVTAPVGYIYDSLGRLIAVIDTAGDTAIYNYDAVGNVLSIDRRSSSLTSIIEFIPKSGPIGTTVTLQGTAYSPTPSQNTVTFNGTAATVTTATANSLTATVPAGATSGLINVTTPAGSAASSVAFNVTGAVGAPTITNFTPTVGTVGAAVTITGTNFDATATNQIVRFNGAITNVTSSTSTTINTTVPTGTGSGHISVQTSRGSVTSTADFFIPSAPFVAADVQSTGRMTIGGSSFTANITTANKIALVVFDGTAGQWINVQMSNVTFPDRKSNVTLLKPNGSTLFSFTGVPQSGGSFTAQLPDTGSYSFSVGGVAGATGGMNVSVSLTTPGTNPLSLSCDGSCVLTCGGSNPALTFVASGGKPPYQWSTTKGTIAPFASDRSRATLNPPANSGSGVTGNAYQRVGCADAGDQSCFNGGAGVFCQAQSYGCNDAVVGGCGSLSCGCPPVGCAPHSCNECLNTTLPGCTNPGALNSNDILLSPNNLCGIPPRGQGVGLCTLIRNTGRVFDLRTQTMITNGCNPCSTSMQGTTVTVTDSNGTPVSKQPLILGQ
jgi:YD repeat-containing protein